MTCFTTSLHDMSLATSVCLVQEFSMAVASTLMLRVSYKEIYGRLSGVCLYKGLLTHTKICCQTAITLTFKKTSFNVKFKQKENANGSQAAEALLCTRSLQHIQLFSDSISLLNFPLLMRLNSTNSNDPFLCMKLLHISCLLLFPF